MCSSDLVIGIVGFSFAGIAQNMGMAFAQLKDWSLRPRADQSVDAILGRAMQRFARIKEGIVISFNLPAVPALGLATGFDLFLQDRAGLGHAKLLEAILCVLRGRHPLWGIGVTSEIDFTLSPMLPIERIAFSCPIPGPLTYTWTSRKP